jgi:putative ABC transport system permease protein
VLGTVGGTIGLILGAWLTALLVRILPASIPRTEDVVLDGAVALVTTLTALVASLFFGIVPALQASRARSADALKDAGGRGTSGRTRARSLLVAGEIALTLMLLTGAGLLINSFLRLQAVDSGLEPQQVTLVSLIVPQARYPSAASQIDLYRRLLERLAERADIQSAGIGFPGPLRGSSAAGAFYIESRSEAPEDRPFANLASVSAGYLPALGVPLLEGRPFADTDRAESPEVAIVSRALARKYWPGESAVGRRVRFDNAEGTPWRTIVGVVDDVKQLGLDSDAPPIMFIPYTQFSLPFTNVAVRSATPSSAVAATIRSELAAIDPDLAGGEMTTLQGVLDRSLAEPRFRTYVLSAFAATALLLAAVGVFGLVSYSVAQRRREIGIRLALGATPGRVLAPMMREGLVLAVLGIGAGLAGALAGARLIATFLYGIEATDPLTFGAVALTLLVVASLATYVPARRSLSVDPIAVLRVD